MPSLTKVSRKAPKAERKPVVKVEVKHNNLYSMVRNALKRDLPYSSASFA